MADTAPSPDEQALRRRARRRLVGAIALALLAVVVLPMVFDPEPRPVGNNVDIRIPGQDTPFEQMPATPQAAAPAAAAPTPEKPVPAAAPTKPEPEPAAKPTSPEPVKPAAKPEPKPEPKPVAKPVSKPAAKPEPKPATAPVKPVTTTKPAEKPQPAAAKKPAEGGYYLQLGVFSSESNAKQMVAQAKKVGFKSSILPVGSQFKVRVGPISDRAKALDYEAKLKAKGLAAVLVEP